MTIYPWQTSQWHILQESRKQGRMPHALLLTGPQGLGKEDFAMALAQSLLCEQVNLKGEACGQCRSCQLYEAGTHPDLSVVSPLEGKKAIAVDQVRGINHYLSLKSQYVGHKIVVVTPAETMNVNAANSLLKTLEEPAAEAILILVTHRPAQLPATIRSRCQELRFAIAPQAMGESWLKTQPGVAADSRLLLALADGAPLKARQIAEDNLIEQRQLLLQGLETLAKRNADPVAVAQEWNKSGVAESLYWMHSWMVDLLRLKACVEPPHIANRDVYERLLNLANQVSLKGLMLMHDRLVSALREIEGNANAVLVIEGLLIQWQKMFHYFRERAA